MNSRAVKAFGVVVSVVSVGGVVWWASTQDTPTWPSSAGDWAGIALGVVGYLVACALRAERWHLLLHFNGGEAARADCYALTAVGFMGNNVLPARGGDVMRTVLLRPRLAGMDARGIVGTLVAERILDVVVLLSLFVVVAFGLLSGIDLPSAGRFEFAGGALVVLAIGLGAGAVVAKRRGALERIVEWARPLVVATRNLHGRHGAEAVAVTAGIWGTEVVVWWTVANSTGLDISLLQTCYLLSLASVFVLIPSGPGYAGTFDSAIAFGVKALGRSNATAYLLLLRFVLFVPITVIGLVVMIARYGGLRTARSATVS